MANTSILELIGKVLLFGILKSINQIRIEDFDNLMKGQEINQTFRFKPFYAPLDLSIHSSEKEIDQFNQFEQFDQWINEENIQEIIKILEENSDKPSHVIHRCILKYAFGSFPFAPILKKIKFSHFSKIVNLIHEMSTKYTHKLAFVDVDKIQEFKETLSNESKDTIGFLISNVEVSHIAIDEIRRRHNQTVDHLADFIKQIEVEGTEHTVHTINLDLIFLVEHVSIALYLALPLYSHSTLDIGLVATNPFLHLALAYLGTYKFLFLYLALH
ncbi:4030_t:CDS:2 [Gigaspora margarita]|uniref:4030_t:CDS:1 n=1 Tax=Gigaspora margarita TaxID=4874 RepID=A0ABN7UE59_GIGMA|nr:4030_t:CDS:2 [Gigaspora margarita]